MSAFQLSTAPNDHPNKSADQRAEYGEHKNDAGGKARANTIDAAASRYTCRGLAPLAGESGGHCRKEQGKQPEKSTSHEPNLALLAAAAQERSDIS